MEKAYLETSAINSAESGSLSGQDLVHGLRYLGFSPVIGMHSIYELARTYLNPDQSVKAGRLFSIVRDLNPSFMPPTWQVLSQEVLKLRTGAAVFPFLTGVDLASAQTEVARLALGIFDNHAERFIRSREGAVKSDHLSLGNQYLNHINQMRTKEPGKFRGTQNLRRRGVLF